MKQEREASLLFVGALPFIHGPVFDVSFSHGSSIMAVASKNGLGLYDRRALDWIKDIRGESLISSLSFSLNDDYLLASGRTNTYLISIDNGEIVHRYNGTSGVFVDSYKKVWTQRANNGFVGSGPALYGCWDIESAQSVVPPIMFGGYSYFSLNESDADYFYYHDFDDVSGWERIDSGTVDSTWVLLEKYQREDARELCLMNSLTKESRDISSLVDAGDTVTGGVFSKDGSVLAMQIMKGQKERLLFVDTKTKSKLSSCNGSLVMASIRKQNDMFAFLQQEGESNSVAVVDIQDGRTIQSLLIDSTLVACVEWSPDGRFIAIGTRGGNVGIWVSQAGQ